MIMRGHYVGLTITELEKIRSQLMSSLESFRQGKTFSEVDMGGKMGKKQLLSYPEIVQELKEVQFALKKALPEVYGRSVKRLIPNFNKTLRQDGVRPLSVIGVEKLTGGLIKDGTFNHVDEVSLISFQRGYYVNIDGSAQVSKDAQGVWCLFGIAGFKYDSQVSSDGSPLSSYSKWSTINVS